MSIKPDNAGLHLIAGTARGGPWLGESSLPGPGIPDSEAAPPIENDQLASSPLRKTLEHVAGIAAAFFAAPAAVISLELEGQPLIAVGSLGIRATGPVPQAVCRLVLSSSQPVVSDLLGDASHLGLTNMLLACVRFYAGVPVFGEDGRRIGVLCVYDVEPRRSLPPEHQQMLTTLGVLVSDAVAGVGARSQLAEAERTARDNAQFLKVAQVSAQSGFWRISLKPLRFTLTEETCALYDVAARSSFTAATVLQHFHPEDIGRIRKIFTRSLLTGCLYVEYRVPLAAGGYRWLASRGRIFREAGSPPSMVGVSYDITSLKATEQRYALATRASRDGLWDWNLHTNVVYFSPRWQAIAGFAEIELCDTLAHWTGRIHEADRARVEAELNDHLNGCTAGFESEHRMRHTDGTWRWVKVHGLAQRDAKGHPDRVAGSISDITMRKMADPLTGLPNRLLILDRLEARIERGHRLNDWTFAVLSVHLDRFKLLNDMLGYSGGDALLIEIAQRLNVTLLDPESVGHTIARVGGGEFLIFLENTANEEDALKIANAVEAVLATPFLYQGSSSVISASLGLVMSGPQYLHPEDLIRDADTAMHQARIAGRACLVTFSRSMREKAVNRFQLEAELREGIDAGELMLYYQPEIDLNTRCAVGFEALVRWRHPQRGILAPGEFIPIAEESGLILPLGDWGLETACQQILAWSAMSHGEMHIRVSVNLSAKQFARPGLVERVAAILKTTRIDPRLLCLEVTESSLMGDADRALDTMQRLRELGVGLHMDDFGTGYSSLQYLHRYPFDTLKIDRSFVSRLSEKRESSEIVRTILSLADSLGMSVVAEGIETTEQLECLKDLGCGYGQGYYFSRPMDVSSVSNLFAPISSPHATFSLARPSPVATLV